MANKFTEYLEAKKEESLTSKNRQVDLDHVWYEAVCNLFIQVRVWLKDAEEKGLLEIDIQEINGHQTMILKSEENEVYLDNYQHLKVNGDIGRVKVYYGTKKAYFLIFLKTEDKWVYEDEDEFMPVEKDLTEDSFIEILKNYL